MDYTDLFPDPSPQELAQAQAAALRRRSGVQQDAGQFFQMTGDRALAPAGQSMVSNAQHMAQMYQQAQDRQALRAIQAQRAQDMAQHYGSEDEIRQQLADRQRIFNAKNGETLAFDPNTAEATTIRSALPRATGKGNNPGKPVDVDKDLESLKKDLDPFGRSAGQFGKEAALLAAADKIGNLIPSGPDGKKNFNLTRTQIPELGAAVASMVMSGNQPAESLVEHFIPQTRGMNWAQKAEFFTNHPEAANVPGFVEQLYDTSLREKKGAQGRIANVIKDRLTFHTGAYAKHPKEAAAAVRRYLNHIGGMNPSDDEIASMFQGSPAPAASGGQSAGPSAHPQDSAAIAWAKANPTDPRAAAILKANGVQ